MCISMRKSRKQLVDALELPDFGGRDEAGPGQRLPVVTDAGGACDPQDHLKIANAARAFLAVGLQAVGRVVELGIALGLFQPLGLEELFRLQAGVVGSARIHRTRISIRQESALPAGRSVP
jgi:hypothetical protein